MKKGQSEMVGFALILIIIAVVILVFLSINLKKQDTDFTKSYEVESFIQTFLEETTKCADGYEPKYASLRRTMNKCIGKSVCSNGIDPCKEFNETMTKILNDSWQVGQDWKTKGYYMNITVKGEEFFSSVKGNKTGNSLGSIQNFDGEIDIIFQVFN